MEGQNMGQNMGQDRQGSYLKRASKRFLMGTRCASPCEAVESGKRTLAQWAALLAEERDLEWQHQQSRRFPTHRRKARTITISREPDFTAV
jgi:hypothetical protein